MLIKAFLIFSNNIKEVKGTSTMTSHISPFYNEKSSRGLDHVIPNCSLSDLVLAQIRTQCIKLRKVRKVKRKKIVKKMKGIWYKMKPSSPWSITKKADDSVVHEKNDCDAIATYGQSIRGRRKGASHVKSMRCDDTARALKINTALLSQVDTKKGSYDNNKTFETKCEPEKYNTIPKSALSVNVLSDIRTNKKAGIGYPMQVKKKGLIKSKIKISRRRDSQNNAKPFARTPPPSPPPPPPKQQPLQHFNKNKQSDTDQKRTNTFPKSALGVNLLSDIRTCKKEENNPRQVEKRGVIRSKIKALDRSVHQSGGKCFGRAPPSLTSPNQQTLPRFDENKQSNNDPKKVNSIAKSALSLNVLSDIRTSKKVDHNPWRVKKKGFIKSKIKTFERRYHQCSSKAFARTPSPSPALPPPPLPLKQQSKQDINIKEYKRQEMIKENHEIINRDGKMKSGCSKAIDREENEFRPCLEASRIWQRRVDKDATRNIEEGQPSRVHKQFKNNRIETGVKSIDVNRGVVSAISNGKMKEKNQVKENKEQFEKKLAPNAFDNEVIPKTLKRPRPRPPPPPRRKQNPKFYENNSFISSSRTEINEMKRSEQNQRNNRQPQKDVTLSKITCIKKTRSNPGLKNLSKTSGIKRIEEKRTDHDQPQDRRTEENKQVYDRRPKEDLTLSKIKTWPKGRNLHPKNSFQISEHSPSVPFKKQTSSIQFKAAAQREIQNDEYKENVVRTVAPPPVKIQKSALSLSILSDIRTCSNQLKEPNQQLVKNKAKSKQYLFDSIKTGNFELKKPSDRVKEPSPEKLTIFSEIKKGKTLRRLSYRLLQVKKKTKRESLFQFTL